MLDLWELWWWRRTLRLMQHTNLHDAIRSATVPQDGAHINQTTSMPRVRRLSIKPWDTLLQPGKLTTYNDLQFSAKAVRPLSVTSLHHVRSIFASKLQFAAKAVMPVSVT